MQPTCTRAFKFSRKLPAIAELSNAVGKVVVGFSVLKAAGIKDKTTVHAVGTTHGVGTGSGHASTALAAYGSPAQSPDRVQSNESCQRTCRCGRAAAAVH